MASSRRQGRWRALPLLTPVAMNDHFCYVSEVHLNLRNGKFWPVITVAARNQQWGLRVHRTAGV